MDDGRGISKEVAFFEKRRIGRREGEVVILHPVEVLYLIEIGKAKAIYKGKEMGIEDYIALISSNEELSKRFVSLYAVYYDLRNRGHRAVPEYRTENTIVIFKKDRARIEVLVLEEGVKISLRSFLDWLEGVRKMDLQAWVAIVDRNGNITYYEVSKIEPLNKFSEPALQSASQGL